MTMQTGITDKPLDVSVDILVIGGGVAGLWTHARLRQQGYSSVLLENRALGAGQTRYAQGIIHGGTKYALTGKLTASSEAVADMPARWRACYQGKGELDLTQAELLSDAHYLWSTNTLTSKISGFFASKVMRSRSSALDTDVDNDAIPPIFQHQDFKGQFYKLDEPVFNTLSVIKALAEPIMQSILIADEDSFAVEDDHVLVSTDDGSQYRFQYKKMILMAGEGNERLLSLCSQHNPVMQRRPLKMVVMRGSGENGLSSKVYAHCLGASVNPRITITSHFDSDGNIVWYMGGQLAEEGVNKSDDELIADTKKELSALIPWLSLENKQWGVLKIDRAEIKKTGTTRPDSFSIEENKNVITAWPTKLALSPALADAIVDIVKKEVVTQASDQQLPAWSAPGYADFPWNDSVNWVR